MAAHREFLSQLENFKHEADVAAQYLYSDMAVEYAVSKSKKLLGRLNSTPVFWLTHRAGMQVATYVTIGRVFDTKSRYNVNALLDAFESSLNDFSQDALAERKREGRAMDPEWLPEYLAKSHYPSEKDVNRLRAKVSGYREVYDRAVKPVRHKYIAHREKKEHLEVQALFAGGTVRELWRLVTFLLALHEALWQQYHNGRKPVLRPTRYSVKAIYDSSEQGRNGPHERIVAE
ncbi:MAG: transposase, partial [Cytophagaceae bacterium]